jgi:DNA-directed RNA polymerase subunit M/transcription elongation factor TFIIS
VPRESRRTDFEEYAFHDNSPPAVDTEPEIAFECPVCRTRMTAPNDQVGQQKNCPDCRTPVTVPAKLAPRRRKQAAPVDAYTVSEDFDPAAPPAPQPEYIAVHCGRCGTLMQIAPDRVGSEVTCPDCKKTKVVDAPRLRGKREASTTSESYEVSEEGGQSPAGPVARREHVGFVCRCGTRLHALASEAGQQRTCPECGRSVTVPSPRRKRPKPDPAKEIDGQYDAQAETAAERQASAAYQPPMWFSDRFKKMLDEHGRSPPPPRPPRWPLVSGVFNFPWRRGCLAKWVWLSIGAMLIAEMELLGWSLGRGIGLGAGIAAAGPAVLSMLFQVLAGCLAVCWAGVFFINLLTILGDTAAGADEVGQWPDAIAFVDWAGSTFFVINSLGLSLLAGQGLGRLLDRVQLPGVYAMVGVPLVLFPWLLLSMLEANSPLVPVSRAVCGSLLRKWRAWLGFYLETILLLAVIGASAIAAMLIGSLPVAMPVLAMTMVASLMIYFRLLGRLAWCCSR